MAQLSDDGRRWGRGRWVVSAIAASVMVLAAVWLVTGRDGRATPMPSTLARPAAPAPGSVAHATRLDSPGAAAARVARFAHFSNGLFQVGPDVRPGIYRMRSAAEGCYFARLKGFSGSLDDVLANDNPAGPAAVTVLPTDRGFQSDNCATWTADLSPIVTGNSFGAGDYIVGTDLQPGTYRDAGAVGNCYYARLSGFTHEVGDIIANGKTESPAIVTVAASDTGFTSTGCGTWTKVG